jgi:hypothetical protein
MKVKPSDIHVGATYLVKIKKQNLLVGLQEILPNKEYRVIDYNNNEFTVRTLYYVTVVQRSKNGGI